MSAEHPDAHAGLLIKDGKIEPVWIDKFGHGANAVRELIGDAFCSCFHIPITTSRVLVGYCDDNFLQKPELTLNVFLSANIYDWPAPGYPIHGPIVVSAVRVPDTVSMTDTERSRFYIEDSSGGPILRYNWHEHQKERVWHPKEF